MIAQDNQRVSYTFFGRKTRERTKLNSFFSSKKHEKTPGYHQESFRQTEFAFATSSLALISVSLEPSFLIGVNIVSN